VGLGPLNVGFAGCKAQLEILLANAATAGAGAVAVFYVGEVATYRPEAAGAIGPAEPPAPAKLVATLSDVRGRPAKVDLFQVLAGACRGAAEGGSGPRPRSAEPPATAVLILEPTCPEAARLGGRAHIKGGDLEEAALLAFPRPERGRPAPGGALIFYPAARGGGGDPAGRGARPYYHQVALAALYEMPRTRDCDGLREAMASRLRSHGLSDYDAGVHFRNGDTVLWPFGGPRPILGGVLALLPPLDGAPAPRAPTPPSPPLGVPPDPGDAVPRPPVPATVPRPPVPRPPVPAPVLDLGLGPALAPAPATIPPPVPRRPPPVTRRCAPCGCLVSGEANWHLHLMSGRHKHKGGDNFYRCTVCGALINGEANVRQHKEGARHLKNVLKAVLGTR
jgi:hypothetical protein